jgi:hypothetical protein
LDLWSEGFGMSSGAKRQNGDADDDGDVDGADFLQWQRVLTNGSAAAATGVVPEPSATALLCFGLAAMIAGPRRGRRRYTSAGQLWRDR